MVITMVTRFTNMRCVKNVNNFSSIGNTINVIKCSSILSKPYSTVDNELTFDSDKRPNRKITKAMKIYFKQAEEYKEFVQKQIAEYNIGKRHLANMMGENPDNFSEADINRSLKYLFPSGLYEPEARPKMTHPSKLYATRKEAEFDESGRPHHFLFYTTKPNYYELLHRIAENINILNKIEDAKLARSLLPTPEDKFDIGTSEWFNKTELQDKLLEELSDEEYEYFLKSIEKVSEHPFSNSAASFLNEWRKTICQISSVTKLPNPQYDDNKRPYILLKNCARKSSRGDVKVIGNGTGNITINGEDITYFKDINCREQRDPPVWMHTSVISDNIMCNIYTLEKRYSLTKVMHLRLFEKIIGGEFSKRGTKTVLCELLITYGVRDLSWSPGSQNRQCVQEDSI